MTFQMDYLNKYKTLDLKPASILYCIVNGELNVFNNR